MTWTAHAILATLRRLSRRPTQPAEPTAEYRAERARILGEAHVTGVPPAAITAAMTAVMGRHGQLEADGADVIAYEMGEFRADVEAALAAAAPFIAAAAAEVERGEAQARQP